ncbi:MAG: molybdopterin cofactor-binding domain-containing protein, partial [Planctomycetota bacterium]
LDVFVVPSGVAVLATGYWPAFKGRKALAIEWADGPGALLDTDRLRVEYQALASKPGIVARDDGDFDRALSESDETLDVEYEVPFMAHVPMEPLSCMVTLNEDGGAHIVTGSQMLGADHPAAAARLGVDPAQVTFENSFLGGGFGRRANPKNDFVIDAIEVALAHGKRGLPIKTVWAREDDVTGGWYRPMFVNRTIAGLKDGKIHAWHHRIVGQSIATGTAFEGAMVVDGIDNASVEGAHDMPHGVPNLRVDLHTTNKPVTVQWWRSVGHSNTAFAKECFIDECAHALGRDPLELQRELLEGHERLLGVLNKAAEGADWGAPLPDGHGRGVAVHESFGSFAAHVVEASVENGQPRVHRVVCAIDCGTAVNPDQVIAQMEGATNFALSATLEGQITFTEGRVDQTNFDTFKVVRMDQSPKVDVHIVNSGEQMGGIGEVGVPPVASALCNALFAASGKRIRRLPIGDQLA